MGAEQDAVKLDEYRRKKKGEQPPGDERPVIKWSEERLSNIVDEAEEALVAGTNDLYRQGQRVVRVVWDQIKVSGGGEGHVLRLVQVTAPHLIERFTASARWLKFNIRADDWLPHRCPDKVAEIYLARHLYKLPFILGVVTTPTLRPDGSVLDVPGYDATTGIYYNPTNINYPEIPKEPTREDALAALELLKTPLNKFSFIGAGRSVALSAIMTAVVRRALPVAPMHAFSASTAGAGKSMLVDVVAMIATGERAAVLSAGDEQFGRGELEKRLVSALLGGDLVITIDNVEGMLGGDMLCQAVTQHMLKLRRLGSSDEFDTPNTAFLCATGNNLTMVGDMNRRTLIASVDVTDERPELRRFDFHPVAMARANRGEYVKAVLTIIRAFLLSGEGGVAPLGSFEEWSHFVRDPLIWLGEADAASVLEDTRRNDPRLGRLQQVMQAWKMTFGSEPKEVRDVVAAAMERDRFRDGEPYVSPELNDAIYAIGGKDGRIRSETVAWWLRKNQQRIVQGQKFVVAETGVNGRLCWQLLTIGTTQNSTLDEEVPF